MKLINKMLYRLFGVCQKNKTKLHPNYNVHTVNYDRIEINEWYNYIYKSIQNA